VWLALACALHPTKGFGAVLGLALKLLRNDPNFDPARLGVLPTPPVAGPRSRTARRLAQKQPDRRSKHDPRGGGDPFQVSESAFTQARKAMPWRFWVALVMVLSERFEDRYPGLDRYKHFRLLALDGTCLDLERWSDLVRRAGGARNGKAVSSPRARLVLLQRPLVRLPWRFDLVPYDVGERTVAAGLLDDLRADDLVLMDRGFWSYGLFWQIQQQQAFFAIRLVSGVTFQNRRALGTQDRVVQWTPTDRKWKAQGLPAAITLRVITYQIKGFRSSAVVTSVLDPAVISRDEWVRLATVDQAGRVITAGLYHRRWEIETTFLELKVTQGMAGSFRSRTTEGIAFEVAGHLLLYLLMRLLMVEAAVAAGVEPLRLSYQGALEEVQDMGQSLLRASRRHAERVLQPRLVELISSHQVPLRPGRHTARPGDTKAKTDKRGHKQLPSKIAGGEADRKGTIILMAAS
jgi:hypothetical protein